jgi:sulfite reductase alpha subunit-like flavoprotein
MEKKKTNVLTGLELFRVWMFGLGNFQAYFVQHFNITGKALDERLAEMGAKRVLDLVLGDDSTDNIIEEDFETYTEDLLDHLKQRRCADD